MLHAVFAGAAMRDARTGDILWSHSPGIDVGAGLVADIDPVHAGCEAWGGPGGLRNAMGEPIGRSPRSTGYAVWWDGDLLRELIGRNQVMKWDWEAQQEKSLFTIEGRGAPRGPNLIGDIRRLARRNCNGCTRWKNAASIHHNNSNRTSYLHTDARSSISLEHRLAERGLQQTAAHQFLSGPWYATATHSQVYRKTT